MRRGVAGVLVAAVLGLATACGSPAAKSSHPDAAASRTASPSPSPSASPTPGTAAQGGAGLWPGASWRYDALPARPLYAELVKTDRAFQMAVYDAIYTRGASHSYAAYISDSQVLKSVQQSVAQQVAERLGFSGVERYYRTNVQPFPKFPGMYVVDFCVDDARFLPTDVLTGHVVPRPAGTLVHYEEQDVYARVAGQWKINTIDTFDATSGYALVSAACYPGR